MPDPVAVNSMFGRIARRYDLANRVLSGGADVWWRWRLVRAVARAEPRHILDLATGSGDVAFALARRLPPDLPITGMDFCPPMLEEAERKRAARGVANVRFAWGDALALPLAAASVDAVTLSFGFRNFADRSRGLAEIHRVLTPGRGRLFVLESTQPWRWFRPFYYLYLRRILPDLATRLTGDEAAYQYLGDTIGAFPAAPDLAREFAAAGFTRVTWSRMTGGIVALHIAER